MHQASNLCVIDHLTKGDSVQNPRANLNSLQKLQVRPGSPDHTIGSHAMTRDDYRFSGDAAGALAAFDSGAAAWRAALVSADEAALDMVGRGAAHTTHDARRACGA